MLHRPPHHSPSLRWGWFKRGENHLGRVKDQVEPGATLEEALGVTLEEALDVVSSFMQAADFGGD